MKTNLDLASGWADRLITRAARASMGFLLWPVVYAIAVTAGLWPLVHPSLRDALGTNKLAVADRMRALYFLGASLAAVVIVYTLAVAFRAAWARIRHRPEADAPAVSTIGTLNRWLFPIVAFPFVVRLAAPGVEKASPKATLFFIAIAAATLGRSAYLWASSRPEPDEPGAGRLRRALSAVGRFAAPASVLGLALAYGAFFSRLAITNHHALVTRTIDLGYYDNIFYQSLHGHPLGCSFIKAGSHSSAHFDPILIVLSQIYRVYPRAETLLVLQSFWLGLGAIPVYLLGRKLLGARPSAVALAAMYCAYPALHGANMYEFHSLTLLTTPLLWLLYFLEAGHVKRYFATLALLLLVREDVPLILCFVGLYAIVVPRAGTARIGRYTIAIAIAYFAIVKAFFMQSSGILNAGKDAYSFEYYYDAMIPDRNGIGGLVASIVTNPLFALELALDEPKVIFLLQIFLPLAFLPFCAKWGRLMLIYGLMFCLLASRGPVFTIYFQYASILIPIAVALTPVALAQIREGRLAGHLGLEPRRFSRALLAGAFAATMLVSWKFGGIVDNASFKGGFTRVTRTLTDAQKEVYAWVDAQTSSIPAGASVGTTNRLGAHVSNRMRAVFYPSKADVDYLFIDEGELKAPELEKHKQAVERGDFSEVSRNGKLVLLKRKGL